ncbi:hypothetical protein ACFFRR_005380 [Megaselia abdita]
MCLAKKMSLCLCYYLVIPILISAYPYSDAKRYQRAQLSLPTTPAVISPIPRQSYYNHYYKQQSMPYYYDKQDNSDYNSRIASNGFYHYPSHTSKYYGMPTYQGEYMPQPYYYAKSPRYSYLEDPEEPTSNPLDDLHEEIRYEEQKDLDYWYDHKQREAQTNNFLRNLIAYNREIEEEERLEKENDKYNPKEYDYVGTDYDYEMQPRLEQPMNSEYYDLPTPQRVESPSQNYYPTRMFIENFDNRDEEVKQLNNLINTKDYNRIDDKVDFSDQRKNNKYVNYENNAEYELNDDWISWERKRSVSENDQDIASFTYRKQFTTLAPIQSTTSLTTAIPQPESLDTYGQKEKVLFRPANLRHQLKPSLSDKMERSNPKNTGNIYDTIKHLIALDKALDNENGSGIRFKQKRFAKSEDTLAHELDKLKENHKVF